MGFFSDIKNAITGESAADAAREAAGIQSQAAREAMAAQARYMEPYYQSGMQAQNRLMAMLGLGGDTSSPEYGMLNRQFSMQDFQADPGYAFRMEEGLKGLQRAAAARGGALSGNALRAITQYGQDLASQEYGNAYNRFLQQRQAMLNPLQSMAGYGRSAAGSLGGIYGQGLTDIGTAQASGVIGGANARQQGMQNIINLGLLAAGAGGFGGAGALGAARSATGGGGISSYLPPNMFYSETSQLANPVPFSQS